MFDHQVLVGYLAHASVVAFCIIVLGILFPSCVAFYFTCVANFLLYLQLCMFTFEFTRRWHFTENVSSAAKAVLITGCDSGFGHQLAKRLDNKGFHVFAACLFPEGDGALHLKNTCSENMKILGLDVTKDESVSNAVEFVKNNLGFASLWAIVNNAGIFKGFCLDMSTVQDVKDTIDVNAVGPVRVTKAFLPLLRKSKGRVVNLTSLAGRLTSAYMMPYCMSKFAAVAFTECLKQELKIWGIRVISIEPEGFRTPMVEANNRPLELEAAEQQLPDDIKDLYGKQYKKKIEFITTEYCKASSTKIDIVIDDLESAICLKHPKSVYKPCRSIVMSALIYLAERLPTELRDWTSELFLRCTTPSIKASA